MALNQHTSTSTPELWDDGAAFSATSIGAHHMPALAMHMHAMSHETQLRLLQMQAQLDDFVNSMQTSRWHGKRRAKPRTSKKERERLQRRAAASTLPSGESAGTSAEPSMDAEGVSAGTSAEPSMDAEGAPNEEHASEAEWEVLQARQKSVLDATIHEVLQNHIAATDWQRIAADATRQFHSIQQRLIAAEQELKEQKAKAETPDVKVEEALAQATTQADALKIAADAADKTVSEMQVECDAANQRAFAAEKERDEERAKVEAAEQKATEAEVEFHSSRLLATLTEKLQVEQRLEMEEARAQEREALSIIKAVEQKTAEAESQREAAQMEAGAAEQELKEQKAKVETINLKAEQAIAQATAQADALKIAAEAADQTFSEIQVECDAANLRAVAAEKERDEERARTGAAEQRAFEAEVEQNSSRVLTTVAEKERVEQRLEMEAARAQEREALAIIKAAEQKTTEAESQREAARMETTVAEQEFKEQKAKAQTVNVKAEEALAQVTAQADELKIAADAADQTVSEMKVECDAANHRAFAAEKERDEERVKVEAAQLELHAAWLLEEQFEQGLETEAAQARDREALPIAKAAEQKIAEAESQREVAQLEPSAAVANQCILKPSVRQNEHANGHGFNGLKPSQELQDFELSINCLCFGQEHLHRDYILLAASSNDGTGVIYRCYRTKMELALLSEADFPQNGQTASQQTGHESIAVHSRIPGHSRAITCIMFNHAEDKLVSCSIDKSVRIWNVDSGAMLSVFTDNSPVRAAAFFPGTHVIVCSTSRPMLRVVESQRGDVSQNMYPESEVLALEFDANGHFLFAGSRDGFVEVLEASENQRLTHKFRKRISYKGGVSSITFVHAAHGQNARLLVSTSDSSVKIVDCMYTRVYGPDAFLEDLSVCHELKVLSSLVIPLKSCYSPSGQGYVISGSEDKDVYIYSLAKDAKDKLQRLKHHKVPVAAVAVNAQDTLLASGDSLGRIVLWRRA